MKISCCSPSPRMKARAGASSCGALSAFLPALVLAALADCDAQAVPKGDGSTSGATAQQSSGVQDASGDTGVRISRIVTTCSASS
jgi:hypothetical protein